MQESQLGIWRRANRTCSRAYDWLCVLMDLATVASSWRLECLLNRLQQQDQILLCGNPVWLTAARWEWCNLCHAAFVPCSLRLAACALQLVATTEGYVSTMNGAACALQPVATTARILQLVATTEGYVSTMTTCWNRKRTNWRHTERHQVLDCWIHWPNTLFQASTLPTAWL